MSVAIIGAGITGLVLANLIKNKKVVIFEEDNIGGKIKTEYFLYNDKNYFIELGPDALIFDPKKLEKIEKFFPNLFKEKNFIKNNPLYIFQDKKLFLLPTNFIELFKTSLLSSQEKFLTLLDFLLNFFYNNIDKEITLKEYCNKRLSKSFCRKVLEPLLTTVFGLPSDRLVLQFVYPLIKKSIWHKVKMFNCKYGLQKCIEKLLENLEIRKEKIESIDYKGDKFVLKGEKGELGQFDKIILTGQANNIIKILKNFRCFENQKTEPQNLINSLINILSKINYHSSFVNVFVLKKIFKLKTNGIIFNSDGLIKSITFFSKKWYDNCDLEIIRVFSNSDDYENILRELKEFFLTFGYDFEKNILKYFKKVWEKALLDYDINYLKNLTELKGICKKLEDFGIFVFGSFFKGNSIIDRIIFCIDNFYKI